MPDRKKRVRGNDPALSAPRRRPGMRSLSIRGETWSWRFGNHLAIRGPDDRSHSVDLTEVLGCDWNDIERAAWKRSLAVEPSRIVDHIDRRILGYTDQDGFPLGSPWRGHQAAVREGWTAFEGPRGTWQARPGVWITDIRSPEDVPVQARTYQILGMDIHEWTGIKVAQMEANGHTFDEYAALVRERAGGERVDRVRLLMEYEAPGTPVPTVAQLRAYVEAEIACERAAAA